MTTASQVKDIAIAVKEKNCEQELLDVETQIIKCASKGELFTWFQYAISSDCRAVLSAYGYSVILDPINVNTYFTKVSWENKK